MENISDLQKKLQEKEADRKLEARLKEVAELEKFEEMHEKAETELALDELDLVSAASAKPAADFRKFLEYAAKKEKN